MNRPGNSASGWITACNSATAWLLVLALVLSPSAAQSQESPPSRQQMAPHGHDGASIETPNEHETERDAGQHTKGNAKRDTEYAAPHHQAKSEQERARERLPEPVPRSEPRQPPVKRSDSLMGRGPSSLTPSVWPSPEEGESTHAFVQHTANEHQDFEPGELVLLSDNMADAIASARQLAAYQLRIKRRQRLEKLGMVVSVFRLPAGLDTLGLLMKVRRDLPSLQLDLNHRYRLMKGTRQRYGQEMIALPAGAMTCLANVRIGLLDTTVNLAHPALAGRSIDMLQLAGRTPAPGNHGTAIASLWVGDPGQGFTPMMGKAAISAAAVFRQRGSDIDTTTDILARGMDWLLGQQVDAINLSLGGRENRILNAILQRLLAEDILLVAAAGNLGPKGPAVYPASLPGVVAATAVDAHRRLYSLANQGDYIDFAGPGVDVWAANEEGVSYHTGTSFAVPFVLASLLATRYQSDNWLAEARESAIDLGSAGKNARYGWGLVQWPSGCR